MSEQSRLRLSILAQSAHASPPERHAALVTAYRKVLDMVPAEQRAEVFGLLRDLAILTANYGGETALEQIEREYHV